MSETTVVEVGADQFRLLPNGLWIDCYDNGIVESTPFAAVLTALAAARREVETVNEEAERQAGVICNLNTDLATSRAALEDVRRVEAWMEDYPDGRYVDVSRGWFCMVDVRRGDDEDVPAESIAALGRALAQEAGDAK